MKKLYRKYKQDYMYYVTLTLTLTLSLILSLFLFPVASTGFNSKKPLEQLTLIGYLCKPYIHKILNRAQ